MKKDLLFYNEYEQFYRFAEESEAFKEFCNEAYGADFSQDGYGWDGYYISREQGYIWGD